MTDSTYFEDTSIFQGILDFDSPSGKLRAEKNGSGIASIYTSDGNAWFFEEKVHYRGKFTCRNVYNAYCDNKGE